MDRKRLWVSRKKKEEELEETRESGGEAREEQGRADGEY